MSIKNYPFVIYALSSWKGRLDSKVSTFLKEGSSALHLLFLFRTERKVMFRFSKNQEWLHYKPTFLGDTILWVVVAPNAQNSPV